MNTTTATYIPYTFTTTNDSGMYVSNNDGYQFQCIDLYASYNYEDWIRSNSFKSKKQEVEVSKDELLDLI